MITNKNCFFIDIRKVAPNEEELIVKKIICKFSFIFLFFVVTCIWKFFYSDAARKTGMQQSLEIIFYPISLTLLCWN